jgi:hypothetical protein
MVASFGASLFFLFLRRGGISLGTYKELLLTIGFTTVCWILTAYLGPQNDKETLIDFYKRVHPVGPGWRHFRAVAGVDPKEAAEYARQDNVPLALLGWVTGVSVIWSGLFLVGNILYERVGYSIACGIILAVTGTILIRVIRRLWN